ncbi:MAG: hypothetical protein DMF56_15865 [Acidobacteria bacterium]|nr:MAG: hypothetical protein DMF56_15865 [Acidobacteriota bacterium]
MLFSRIAKGWTARVPRSHTHAEHPGTAVLWDEQYYEVLNADVMQGGGIRYVLAAWRDDMTFRDFQTYDDASEARIAADWEAAMRQRKHGKLAWFSGMLLGHLPAPIQNRIANEYGVSAPRMTLLSMIPSLVLLGVCVWLYAGARLKMEASPVPVWVWVIAMYSLAESAMRYLVYMGQSRAMGSLPGTIVYAILSIIAPQRFPWPRERGSETFTLAPDEDVVRLDRITMRMPLFTLLSPAEQHRLAQRYDFDYREHAYTPAYILLCGALFGVIVEVQRVRGAGGISAWISLIVAGVLVVEQLVRLATFARRPAGSVLAPVVRLFVRGYL